MNISIASITASAATAVGITAITIQANHSAADAIIAAGLTAITAVTIAAEQMGTAAPQPGDGPSAPTTNSADKASVPALQQQGEGRR